MSDKPKIQVIKKGPYVVQNIPSVKDSEDNPIERDNPSLCRCGASKSKPFCDGTHASIDFDDTTSDNGPTKEFEGKDITIIDNQKICCHAGYCVKGAEKAFFTFDGDKRISHPDKETKEKIIETIRKCPSGSLAYKLNGELSDKYFDKAEVQILKDGPILVRGGTTLKNDEGREPIAKDHYVLCRCGASKNKPFCDGKHKDIKFNDDE